MPGIEPFARIASLRLTKGTFEQNCTLPASVMFLRYACAICFAVYALSSVSQRIFSTSIVHSWRPLSICRMVHTLKPLMAASIRVPKPLSRRA